MTHWLKSCKTNSIIRLLKINTLILFIFLLGGCATITDTSNRRSTNNDYQLTDPFEKFNRRVYNFNESVAKYLYDPIVKVYQFIAPELLRNGFNNVILNVNTLDSIINGLLQGNFKSSWIDTQRVLINSTIGIGGFFDIATTQGLKFQDEDLGQTFAVWGYKNSTYLYLPFLGPTSARDISGNIVRQIFLYDFLSLDNTFAPYVNLEQLSSAKPLLDDVNDNALDPYSSIKNGFTQKRRSLILNGETEDDEFFDLLDDLEE